jgi:hypothetical protein
MDDKKKKLLEHKDEWTLREVRQVMSLMKKDDTVSSDIGCSYAAVAWYCKKRSISVRTYLPQLRNEVFTGYSSKRSYEKRVDAFISKHGPDAKFPSATRRKKIPLTVEPIKESDNDEQLKPSKEIPDLDQGERGAKAGKGHPDGQPVSEDPNSTTVEQGESGLGHRESPNLDKGEASAKWDISLGGVNPGVKQGAELPSPPSQDNVYSKSIEGDKVGFGPSPDALDSVSKGNAFPGDKDGPSKELEQDDKNGSNFRLSERNIPPMTNPVVPSPEKLGPGVAGAIDSRYGSGPAFETLGDVSSPLNPFSFGTFALSGVKGQRAWGLSNPTTKISLKDLIGSKTLSSGLDESWLREDTVSLSRESSFRSGSPGGYVDENKAKLEKKSVKGQARKIARHFVGFFRDNEVGIGAEQTPRISGAKIVKELLGKSARLSRAKKEEKGAGLKLILVDISPSCGAIRDACFAAALAIAEQDPDVVVLAHFNGYTATDSGHIIGHRQKEIPHIYCTSDLEKFEAFLAKGKVAGAVCFGDEDASEVYALLANYCPMLWMSPDSEGHCRYAIEVANNNASRVYKEARMYIIGGVTNAQTAVEGLKKLRGKK